MTHPAIIPRVRRISSVECSHDTKGGVTMPNNRYTDYIAFGGKNPISEEDLATIENTSQRQWVRSRGSAILNEIYDTVELDIPFKIKDVSDELSCIAGLKTKSRGDYIGATLRWASKSTCSVRKLNLGLYVLTHCEEKEYPNE